MKPIHTAIGCATLQFACVALNGRLTWMGVERIQHAIHHHIHLSIWDVVIPGVTSGVGILHGALCAILIALVMDIMKTVDYSRFIPALPALLTSKSLLSPGSLDLHPPSKDHPDTIGWRCWLWNITDKTLLSPQQSTRWEGPELRCESWDESDVVRGVAGVHAHLVPVDWEDLISPEAPGGGLAFIQEKPHGICALIAVHGLVERFGKYVLGTEGFRCEWAVIRKIVAPTTEIGLDLEQAFPDVEIVYPKEKDHGNRDDKGNRGSQSSSSDDQSAARTSFAADLAEFTRRAFLPKA